MVHRTKVVLGNLARVAVVEETHVIVLKMLLFYGDIVKGYCQLRCCCLKFVIPLQLIQITSSDYV
jgi:hypothetical protein